MSYQNRSILFQRRFQSTDNNVEDSSVNFYYIIIRHWVITCRHNAVAIMPSLNNNFHCVHMCHRKLASFGLICAWTASCFVRNYRASASCQLPQSPLQRWESARNGGNCNHRSTGTLIAISTTTSSTTDLLIEHHTGRLCAWYLSRESSTLRLPCRCMTR